MWRCPKCRSKVDDSFEVCWSCGTTPDGVEVPRFVTADDAEPIADEEVTEATDFDDPFADLVGTPMPDLVECYTAGDAVEAKFIADRLMEEGVPAIADKIDVNMVMGGIQPQMWGCGPKIRVRRDDLPKAQAWLEGYEKHRRSKRHTLD
jgi:hypothetical protein